MKHIQTIGNVVLVLICVSGCSCPGSTPTGKADRNSEPAETYKSDGVAEKTIPYEIVHNKKRKDDGRLVMDVLVSEKESKENVIKLGTFLSRKYAGKYAFISIYDARRALQAGIVEDLAYPQKEFDLHCLLVADWGGDLREKEEIRWCAKGRDH
jgi:hypothetical protein